MLPPIDANIIIDSAATELGKVAVACQKYGLVCTTQPEFDKFTYVVGGIGIIIGIVCCLAFQWTRKKAAEKIAAKLAQDLEDEHRTH